VGLFQQMRERLRERPERIRAGKFMAAFFREAPLSIVEVTYKMMGRNALALGMRDLWEQVKKKEGVQIPEGDPGEQMKEMLEAWTTGDVHIEHYARIVIAQASIHRAYTIEPLEMVRAATAVFREIQSHKYVLDDISFESFATPQTIIENALEKALARIGDGG
jgi:hypothetical protein